MKSLENYYLGFDRDGTLESEVHPFPAYLQQKIENLRQKGAKTFIASGRSIAELEHIAKQHQLHFDLFCGESGADILGTNLQVFYKDLTFFKEKIQEIQLPASEDDLKKVVWTKYFGKNLPEAEKIVQNFIHQHQLKLKLYGHPDYNGALDVVPLEVDKTNILAHIPEQAEIFYFGDSANDLGMMRSARVQPFAPSNATEEVKKIVLAKNGKIANLPAGEGVLEILNFLFP